MKPPPSPTALKLSQKLRDIGVRFPDVEEGVACAGTAIEKRTLKVRKKAFLFLGPTDAMLKLNGSIKEAQEMSMQEPDRYRAGLGGWTKIVFEDGKLPLKMMERWIRESYQLFADGTKKTPPTPRPTARRARRKPA